MKTREVPVPRAFSCGGEDNEGPASRRLRNRREVDVVTETDADFLGSALLARSECLDTPPNYRSAMPRV